MSGSIFINRLRSLVDLDNECRAALDEIPIEQFPVRRRHDIIRSGEKPDYLYIVLSGWAARYSLRANGTRRITGFLLPGDFCGIHTVCHSSMDHSITAITDCTIGRMHRDAVRDLVAAHPIINDALWRSKLNEEAILRKWLLVSDDALHALSHLFCEFCERLKAIDQTKHGSFFLPITQEDIGDALGLTAVHVNRVIRRLRDLGLIGVEGRNYTILDSAGLTQAASFRSDYLRGWSG